MADELIKNASFAEAISRRAKSLNMVPGSGPQKT